MSVGGFATWGFPSLCRNMLLC